MPKKTLAKKLVSGLKKFSRDLKAGEPLKVTRVVRVKAWGVFVSYRRTPIAIYPSDWGKGYAQAVTKPSHTLRPIEITYSIKGTIRPAGLNVGALGHACSEKPLKV